MARDIEEFLRKAAERRKQAQGGGAAQPAPPPPQPRPAQPRSAQPKKQQPVQQRPPTPVTAEVELVRRGATVAEHVRSHINTSDIAEHVRHLGEEVGLADDKLEQRLHEKFDHNVGDLQRKKRQEPVVEEISLSDELLEMLRSPKSIRQAIILSEILRRPDF